MSSRYSWQPAPESITLRQETPRATEGPGIMFNRLLDPEGYKLPRLAQMGPQIGAEVQRLQALTLPQLATEVMTKAFTPDYTPGDGYTGLGSIADNFLPDYGAPRAGDTTTPEEYALCDLL